MRIRVESVPDCVCLLLVANCGNVCAYCMWLFEEITMLVLVAICGMVAINGMHVYITCFGMLLFLLEWKLTPSGIIFLDAGFRAGTDGATGS